MRPGEHTATAAVAVNRRPRWPARSAADRRARAATRGRRALAVDAHAFGRAQDRRVAEYTQASAVGAKKRLKPSVRAFDRRRQDHSP